MRALMKQLKLTDHVPEKLPHGLMTQKAMSGNSNCNCNCHCKCDCTNCHCVVK